MKKDRSGFTSKTQVISIRGIKIMNIVSNLYLSRIASALEEIEPDTLDWIDTFRNGSVFFDVGASTGPFSLYAAIKKKSKVFAFEPESQNFAILEAQNYLNRKRISKGIFSFNIALADETKLGKLYIFRNQPGAAMKILDRPIKRLEKNTFKADHIQIVLKEKLDDVIDRYNLPFPNYIKIDVDGSEYEVIKGSKKTLANKKLKSVLIELEKTQKKSKKIIDILRGFGFNITQKNQLEDYEGIYNYIFQR
jgi:FkbM family methyltransferase